jgi:hypothetical protein
MTEQIAPDTGQAAEAIDFAKDALNPTEAAQIESWQQSEQSAAPAEAPAPAIAPEALPDLFGGQVRPVAYQFEQPADEATAMPLAEQAEIRNVLASEGIPADLVNEGARRWNAAVAAGPQDDAALKLGMAQCRAQLEQVYRDRLPEVLKLARSEARRMMARSPQIKAALESTQLGNDVWLIGTLANLAQARATKGK